LDAVGREVGKPAPFALRVNPDVDARTHRYIATGLRTSKFGVPFDEARALYRQARRKKGLIAVGVDCHIGSQLLDLEPLRVALTKVGGLYGTLVAEDRLPLTSLDVGGGLGIAYEGGAAADVASYGRLLAQVAHDTGASLVLEPGRFLVGNAGVLLAQVLYRKVGAEKTFVVIDAGMNDLLRPALYDAHHEVRPLRQRRGQPVTVDVVGPVCESSDVLARERALVLPKQGELVALMSAGAYGMSMASTYNSRPRPCEALVSGEGVRIIREREKLEDLWRGEHA
jgi:diaminopimelate decarboxylase